MDKGKGHGVATHHPASVCDKVFVDCGGVGEIGDDKPKHSHRAKADMRDNACTVAYG